jgi:uracil-DNA glycosylase
LLKSLKLAVCSVELCGKLTPEYRSSLWDFRGVILVGRRVERAMISVQRPFGVKSGCMGGYGIMMTIPHPSGRNRFWNDEYRVDALRDCVEEFNFLVRNLP